MNDPLLNRTIKHFRIDKVLGQGGMGAVYRATDVNLSRAVAFKVMHPQFAVQEEFRRRFLQEASSAAKLEHPNIVRIYEYDYDNQLLYIVMEMVAGGSLRDYLKQLYEERKFIDIIEAMALTRQIADALDYAHSQGVLHRDIKPDNILLKPTSSSGDELSFRALITDFGLAKLAEGGVQSMGDNPTGTLPYMSPEQAQAEKIDGRTDLYALGIMLYELTTGRLPFMPRNVMEAIKMHTGVEPDRPTAVRASLSPELEAVILKSIAKKPSDRYQNGTEFAKALRAVESVGGQVKRPAAPAGGARGKPQPEAVPEKVESLSTYLQSMAQAAYAPAMPAPASDIASDQLLIVTEGEPSRTFPISKTPIEIGREAGLDLTLNSPKVSRHQARLERRKDGQYTIMDLGSSNGTFLGETKLLSNIAEVWPPETMVRMGNFWLTLQRSTQAYMTGRAVQNVPSVVSAGFAPGFQGGPGAGAVPQQPPSGGFGGMQSGIAITLTPPALTIEPGGRMDLRVEVLNQSELVEHYQFEVIGIPKEWYTVPMTTLQLMPSTKGNTSLNFHPPRNCNSTAGQHQFTVRVTSQERGKEVGRATALLTINPFYQYEMDMQPRRIRNRGELRVKVTNKGNAPESFTLAPHDREEALHYDPPNRSLSVAPCESEIAVFFVRPLRRPFLGFGSKMYSLEVASTATASGPQTAPGELLSTPSIPWWLLALLILLCLLCLLLLYFLFGPKPPPATATPNGTVTVEHATLDGWLTSTANSFNVRQTSTYTARNATATQNENLHATATGVVHAQETAGAIAATSTGLANMQATLNQASVQTQVAGSLTPKPTPSK